MSVTDPAMAVVFGSVTPPQGDVEECKVHLGCSKEVSSYEVKLQNLDGKYSSGGASPITVGMDGSISIGRGAKCPQLITCRVESVDFESSPTESYLTVSGRCWGERLFRRVVTKTYASQKGEAIVKDLMDYYAGLSHVRGSVELAEDTDTTYTKLEYSDSPLWDILKYIAESADKEGVISYDFRVAPDGKFEFFPKNSKTTSVSLSEKIEVSQYRKDISRVRNKIMIYGIADKSVPLDKDAWTESLTPTDGQWQAGAGEISLNDYMSLKGSYCIQLYAQNNYFGAAYFALNSSKEVNTNLYPLLNMFLYVEKTYTGDIQIILFDTGGKNAYKKLTVGTAEWRTTEVPVGATNAGEWNYVQPGFDWTQINLVGVICYFQGVGTGKFWIDGLYFGGRRYAAVLEDTVSQVAFGLREFSETDEELWGDNECELRARALLNYLKDPAEYLTVRSTVIDYGTTPLLAGDNIHVTLPNENVDSDFRVESVEYHFLADVQTLELTIELGKEPPQLADYLYGLRTFTVNVEKLSRTKLGKKGIPSTVQSGNAGAHQAGHTRGDTDGSEWNPPLGGWDPILGWISPSHIGPYNDEPSFIYFRTKNKLQTEITDHVFCPTDNKHGILGYGDKHWKEMHSLLFFAPEDGFYRVRTHGDAHPFSELGKDTLKFGPGGATELDSYIKRVSSGVFEFYNRLQPNGDNAGQLGASDKRIADAYIVKYHGTLTLSNLPRDTAGKILEAEGTEFNPMYVDPNGRYTPATHNHAAGDITSGTLTEARIPNVFTGQVTFQGGIITNSVNCTNWQLADAIFANDFRMTEAEKLGYGKGIAFLDNKGKVLMVLSRNGTLHVAGKIKNGLPKKVGRKHA